MTISRKEFYSLILILFLVLFLPVVIYFLGARKDIRPKAVLAGAANFRLNADTTSVSVGQRVNVLVSTQITDTNVRVSGADFTLLYDRDKLNLVSLNPVLGNNFTETVLIDDQNLPYIGEGDVFSYLRLSVVAKKNAADLAGGTVSLANVTFEAKNGGQGIIKFPNENSEMQVVGIIL
ncbi:hypothetical protein A3D05_01545 [Candidatus Gottesmanbacteria bacterium RIFCSPHIGHO2_02_FULL_40_24]|uniref:Cohesin domain-containing protein n=1 Tax=Candidatus Gottesmanbacteria bacterium RIFCSPHIGHO2_01_FULL_40_15 TaxID=1798376 RepID=A0A1F5YZH8_9BACT|nr:MAG: hypothetical protein A2777_04450 [Candidatus Gottesmanbacteria bacterium RIFCSPHIGHO2_01_FULL_40_15]OGG16350.1 MAG: hypothetical protein A3D05_01545 [Candidatus Gottesmanbacteria bacterium RIFCSPHIGHO2_02_FULL_40_24]OGG22695.1 MAG: hypothetical protein A3B48_05180 [Candidatus Gottesmanbacteria bacterium RIFCSPLOWO2_01_FULL_40_10]OGG23450.1 MAG: hypothetical protein A3E42_00185 [Candidatus Gottesmanbacteria bacterium RIFCSPHIGHO2_12_FULL_40_13]OGG33048.1 MAG: hypothetical protein A3I80_0